MSKKVKILLSILAGILTGAIIIAGSFLFKSFVDGKLPLYTKIAGISVSLNTPEEAKEKVEAEAEKYLKSSLEIKNGEKSLKITPEELGVSILTDKTIQIIKETSAESLNFLDWFNFIFRKNTELDVLTQLDNEKIISKITEEFKLSEIAPIETNFFFDETGNLAIKEGKSGMILDEEKLLSDIKSSAKLLKPKKIELILNKKDPIITKEQLEAKKSEIESGFYHSFELLDPIYSDDWTVKISDHMDWITFSPSAEIEIKQEELNKFIDAELSKWLDRPADPVNIYTDKDGKVVIEGKGSNGLEIRRNQLKKAIELAIKYKVKEVLITVLETEPPLTISKDLGEKGVKERLSVGHTSYYGSPANRVHNIKTGASKFNGKLIAPDEVFSFNKTLGVVDGTTGYRKELVIKPEGTLPEFGGGICQVSTTTYRAALFAGLPIVERNQHTYAVSYYSQILGHGLDATIYLGGPDLRFKNDTGNYLLIQTYTENDYELYIVIYGTSDGRSVEMEGPYISNHRSPGPTIYIDTTELPPGETKQVEKAHGGFDALWYRYISFPNKEKITEEIFTNYKAVSNKILVGVSTDQSVTEPVPEQ